VRYRIRHILVLFALAAAVLAIAVNWHWIALAFWPIRDGEIRTRFLPEITGSNRVDFELTSAANIRVVLPPQAIIDARVLESVPDDENLALGYGLAGNRLLRLQIRLEGAKIVVEDAAEHKVLTTIALKDQATQVRLWRPPTEWIGLGEASWANIEVARVNFRMVPTSERASPFSIVVTCQNNGR
jgi:hypothetical protein